MKNTVAIIGTAGNMGSAIAYCLAANARYQNADLLKEILARTSGKVKLLVEHKRNDASDEDAEFDGLTEEDLQVAIDQFIRKANEPPKQIEGEVKP